MALVQPLPDGPLDIIGDIHGEIDALLALVERLGYSLEGWHPRGRHLVFVGDFCDRGPDSPAVLQQVQRWVQAERAWAVVGNHEINLIRADAKDGSGWFFDERQARDAERYAPFARPAPEQRQGLLDFAASLPVALERPDLRVVHAVWHEASLQAVRQLTHHNLRQAYDAWESLADAHAARTGLGQRMADELARWGHDLEDATHTPPLLAAHAEHETNKQRMNPLKVLTSGLEQPASKPFYAGGKWRFVERLPWWQTVGAGPATVVGHYWRRARPISPTLQAKGYLDIFASAPPDAWLGPAGQVFCVDFSVGGRWIERRAGQPVGQEFKLAALRWPEAELMFDDGSRMRTFPGQPQASP